MWKCIMQVLETGKFDILDKNSLHIVLKQPEKLAAISAEELEKISQRYPYFNTAQLMLTKVYQRDDDYRFTDQLHQAAIYSPDRTVLYNLVHSAKLQKTNQEEESTATGRTLNPLQELRHEITTLAVIESISVVETSTPQVEQRLEEDDDVAFILAGKSTQNQEFVTTNEDVTDVEIADLAELNSLPEKETLTDFTSEELEARSYIEPNKTLKKSAPLISAADMEPMEREILLEAITSSIELEVSGSAYEQVEEDDIIAKPSTTTELLKVEEHYNQDDSTEPLSMAAYLAKRAKEIHFGESKLAEKTNESDSASPKREEKIVSVTSEGGSEKNIFEEEDLPLADNRPTLLHGHKRMNVSGEREHQQSLIDKFIKTEPRITPGKVAEYNLQTVARESLEEDFEFVTETMARLFAQQGKPDKARKAFKKLMEQHPEKSVYFAAQLKNLDRIKKP